MDAKLNLGSAMSGACFLQWKIDHCKLIIANCLVLALLGPVARSEAAAGDADVKRAVSRGLDWLASRQSRRGSWTGNNGHYPFRWNGYGQPWVTAYPAIPVTRVY